MTAPVTPRPGWRFGVFEVDARIRELRRSGVLLKLREQSFQILLALLEAPGEIVTREELRRLLWPSDTFVDFDHSLNTAMMKLRDALGDSTEAPIYIETIPKRGYRFIAPVSSGSYAASQPAKTAPAAPSTDPKPSIRPTRSCVAGASARPSRTRFSAGAAAVVVILGVAIFLLVEKRHSLFPAGGATSDYRIDSITTFRGSVKDPAITPDGRDVAYAWNGGGGDHYDIYVHRIGSRLPVRISYVKTGFVGNPAWSPDQSEIAFTRCDGISDGVYIVPALGGPERKLTSTRCQYHLPTPVVWLTGSRMLMIDRCASSGLHGLVLLSMETGEKRCIADVGPSEWNRTFKYSVSPDQTSIAFLASVESLVCELYTVPISGGTPHRVIEDPGSCDDVMWSPDGEHIVFLSERTNFASLWEVSAKGGKIVRSTYPAVGTFSKDGRRLVYTEEANGEPMSVWRADLAIPGNTVVNHKKLIATQYSELDAQLSPDGTRIVWNERRAFVQELWTGGAGGEMPIQLTHLNTYSGTPRWSPDGKWITFDSRTPKGPQIFIIDAEGRNLRAITEGRSMNVVPSWSQDGKSIYFSSNRTGRKEVWKHSLETGRETQLTTQGGFDPFEAFEGQTVYFSKFDEAGLWKIPAKGGDASSVIDGRPQVLYWGNWALTKSGIYFLNADAGPRARIEFYDFVNRRISPVLSLEENAVFGGPSLSATPDGKTILYTQLDRESVIKMIEFQP